MGDDRLVRYSMPTTVWSDVAAASTGQGTLAREVLGNLTQRYRPALNAHLRARGLSVHEAEDVLQGFISSRLLEQNLLARAEPGAGRFRNFLLTTLDRYAVDHWRRQTSQKRGGGASVSLDAPDAPLPSASFPPADRAFEAALARDVLEEALARTRATCMENGCPASWEIFERQVVEPTLRGAPRVPYARLVAELQLASPAQAASALNTAKRIFRRVLRSVVSSYVLDPKEIDEEINDLRRLLSS